MDIGALWAEIPEQIETERMRLCAVRPGDGIRVLGAVVESRERLAPWMAWAVPEPSLDGSERFARQAYADFVARRELNYTARPKEADDVVAIGLGMHSIDWTVPRFEIGYWARTGYEGKGLVREAVDALTRMAFDRLGAERVEIRCDARNEKSARVAVACGYVLEGFLHRHARTLQGELRDTLVFARLRENAAVAAPAPP